MTDLIVLKGIVRKWVRAEGLRGAARNHGLPISLLRSFLDDNSPNLASVVKIAKAANWKSISLAIADDWREFSRAETIPNRGLAKCSLSGWFNVVDGKALPVPEDFDDPDAFYVRAISHSMLPEGIGAGDYCLISPAGIITINDRIWIEDTEGKVSIKRLIEEEDDSYHLRGWLSPNKGKQTSYDEQRFKIGIKNVAVVAAVFRSMPLPGKKPIVADDPFDKPIAPENTATVQLVGLARAGGEVAYDGELHHDETAPAPPGNISGLAAIEVRGDSANPFLRDGDLVYFQPAITYNPDDHIDRLILATASDGATYIKILRRGATNSNWNLQSINPHHPMMENVELDRISPFVWIHFKQR